jgi:hypothetical protein
VGGQRHPGIPRQGISGSQQGAIIIQAVKLLFCMFNFNAHTITHKKIEFLGSAGNGAEFIVCNSAFTSTTKHDHYKT